MKTWKMIAGNVLSGCVGAALVIGTAQAQRSDAAADMPSEIRTKRLILVDENNIKCGELSAVGSNSKLELSSGDAYLSLGTSSAGSAKLTLSDKLDHFAVIDVDGKSSNLKMNSGSYNAFLMAKEEGAQMALSKHVKEKANMIYASVSDQQSSVIAAGPKSSMVVSDADGTTHATLDWNRVKGSAAISLNGAGGYHWSEPPTMTQKGK